MPKNIELDFTGVEPAQGQAIVRIEPGTYKMAMKLDPAQSSNGKPMVKATFTITAGPQRGVKLYENFVMPRPGTDESPFGQQRFLALLMAAGAKQLTGKVKLNLEQFDNREVLGEVNDETREASEKYKERIVSRVFAFHSVKSAAEAGNGTQAAAQAPAPAAEASKEEPAAALAAEEASVPASVLDNVDDLFLQD